jgi:hypothetical protein
MHVHWWPGTWQRHAIGFDSVTFCVARDSEERQPFTGAIFDGVWIRAHLEECRRNGIS